MKEASPSVAYRRAEEADLAFVFASWLKTYRRSDFAEEMSNDVFFDNHKKVIEKLLQKSHLVIVCDEIDPSHIFGYCCFSTFGEPSRPAHAFHFVYFKSMYRGLGLARGLWKVLGLPEDGPRYATHANRDFHAFKAKYRVEYNPYLIPQIIAGTL